MLAESRVWLLELFPWLAGVAIQAAAGQLPTLYFYASQPLVSSIRFCRDELRHEVARCE